MSSPTLGHRFSDQYSVEIAQHDTDLDHLYLLSSSSSDDVHVHDQQVQLKIVFIFEGKTLDCSEEGTLTVVNRFFKPKQERTCTLIDLCNLSQQLQTNYTTLRQCLSTLEIDEDCINTLIKAIIFHSHHWIKSMREFNKGRKVIPLVALVTRLYEIYEHYERYLMHVEAIMRESTERESAEEFERRNYGRVRASESSVKTMLTSVNVEEEEVKCSICLEKLWVGTRGMAMPCSHVFYGDYILKWLKLSHSCPVCRYEVPTD